MERQLESAPVTMVLVGSLHGTSSPRLSGESIKHARLLARSDVPLPPIVVHRETMRVIDGMHRVLAAMLRGERQIPARFCDGTDADAFVLAVKLNSAHGLPLSLADRKAAAARIIDSHPQWSDRAIAEVAGLSHKTVGAIRRRSPDGEIPQLDARVGQDGRVRPLDPAAGRRRAAELLLSHPAASLRQVAAGAGVSPETARDVRNRLRRGSDPLLPRQQRADPGPPPAAPSVVASVVIKLRRDPALRSSDTMRALVRLLAMHPPDPAQWRQLAAGVPSRWAAPLSVAAADCARAWHSLAVQLRQRAGTSARRGWDAFGDP